MTKIRVADLLGYLYTFYYVKEIESEYVGLI